MKILVLGSEGQIGKSLVSHIRESGEEVIEFDILRDNQEDLRINNNQLLDKLISECDFIHFLAYDVGGAKYLEENQDCYNFIDNNMKIMTNTFDLLNKHKKPFIFASSQMSELQYSTYGILKRIGEKITTSLSGLTVRFWNVYGYENDELKSHVITDFIKMAKYEGVIRMRTDGEESRQFLYAKDCSECLLWLTRNYSNIEKSKNYHITNFEWIKVIDIAKIISEISNCDIITSEKKDSTQKNAMNDADPFILNYWKPKTDIRKGIVELYANY